MGVCPCPWGQTGRRQKPCELLTRVTLAPAFGPSVFGGASHRFAYVRAGPSEASRWWMPPRGAGERTPTWQKYGQRARGGEVPSVSVFDVGILLLGYDLWGLQKQNCQSDDLLLRAQLQVSQQPSRSRLGPGAGDARC